MLTFSSAHLVQLVAIKRSVNRQKKQQPKNLVSMATPSIPEQAYIATLSLDGAIFL